MSQYQIGPFTFINLSRITPGVREQLLRQVKPGQNGVTFWKTGKRADPISLLSVVDTDDVSAAHALLHDYEEQVGVGPLIARWAGIQSELSVIVLDVEEIDGGAHATLLGIGGTRGTSSGMLRCVWTINPINLSEGSSS
jgi:hypothetical protein